MVNLVERTLSPADVKALFHAIVAVRGQGGEGLRTKGNKAADKTKSMFANLKQRLTQSVEPEEQLSPDLQRIRELAGITEAPLAAWAKMKQKYNDTKVAAQDKAQSARDSVERNLADKEAVGIDDVFSAWHDAGSPEDLEEITQILNSLSFTNNEIKNAMVQARLSPDADYDPKVTNLAKAIKGEKLDSQVLQYLDSIGIKESINEKVLSNNAIRDIFVQVIDSLPTPEEQAADAEQSPDEDEVAPNANADPELGDMNLQDSVDFENLTNLFGDVSIMLEQARYGRRRKDGNR